MEPLSVITFSRWPRLKRIAFRFISAYFILYSIPFPLSVLPWVGNFISQKYLNIWNSIVPWVGKHILQVSYDIPITVTGSGDRAFDWVQNFCFLTLAALVTLGWSLVDRKQVNYERFSQWFTLYMRFVLASWMISYGAVKVIPVQMPRPFLTRLVEPYGDFSPQSVLWYFMGSSPTFTIIAGSVELLGGFLLIFPCTTLLGALVSFASMVLVFSLNMCYDVPVKLFSFNLLLMSALLIAPHLQRLADLFVLNRTARPLKVRPLFERRWLRRSLVVAQIAFGLYLVGMYLYDSHKGYNTYGGGAPKPPLYGIWTVEDFALNGEVKPPLITDETRWHRVIIPFQNWLYIQPMNGSNQLYRAQVDMENRTLSLGKYGDQEWKADFTFEEMKPGQMKLKGVIDEKRIDARLVRVDETQFMLNSRGFHWIQEESFMR